MFGIYHLTLVHFFIVFPNKRKATKFVFLRLNNVEVSSHQPRDIRESSQLVPKTSSLLEIIRGINRAYAKNKIIEVDSDPDRPVARGRPITGDKLGPFPVDQKGNATPTSRVVGVELISIFPQKIEVDIKSVPGGLDFLQHKEVHGFTGVKETLNDPPSVREFKPPDIPRNAVHWEIFKGGALKSEAPTTGANTLP